jgi:hypothetical protein
MASLSFFYRALIARSPVAYIQSSVVPANKASMALGTPYPAQSTTTTIKIVA